MKSKTVKLSQRFKVRTVENPLPIPKDYFIPLWYEFEPENENKSFERSIRLALESWSIPGTNRAGRKYSSAVAVNWDGTKNAAQSNVGKKSVRFVPLTENVATGELDASCTFFTPQVEGLALERQNIVEENLGKAEKKQESEAVHRRPEPVKRHRKLHLKHILNPVNEEYDVGGQPIPQKRNSHDHGEVIAHKNHQTGVVNPLNHGKENSIDASGNQIVPGQSSLRKRFVEILEPSNMEALSEDEEEYPKNKLVFRGLITGEDRSSWINHREYEPDPQRSERTTKFLQASSINSRPATLQNEFSLTAEGFPPILTTSAGSLQDRLISRLVDHRADAFDDLDANEPDKKNTSGAKDLPYAEGLLPQRNRFIHARGILQPHIKFYSFEEVTDLIPSLWNDFENFDTSAYFTFLTQATSISRDPSNGPFVDLWGFETISGYEEAFEKVLSALISKHIERLNST